MKDQYRQRKWDLRYLALARHIATWSKDPSTKVGAVMVGQDNMIKGTGFNGFAHGEDDSEARYANRTEKLKDIVHAEVNAIGKDPPAGFTIYSSFPFCPDCARMACMRGARRLVCCPLDTNHRSKSWADEWRALNVAARTVALCWGRTIEEMYV